MKAITLFNTPIRVDESGMICLTDMWKASGKSESESPYHYLRNKQTKEFLSRAGEKPRICGFYGTRCARWNLWRKVRCL
ncbi:KilA-N domain-containing protein [Salmonella enterica subsp. enterica serovar Krefeld]|nr:KilA-N domain-containing protein [Salmonella enterica subsp. enterica serovar Krefeld]